MPLSLFDPEVQAVFNAARSKGLFRSPEDWRDVPIYFLMVDRFDNPAAAPQNLPFDASFGQFQGGNFAGVKAKLQYIKDLGFGAIWLSPVLKNPAFDTSAYHGYGIQNFLVAEPRFATDLTKADDELLDLVQSAHAVGLYVIFDIVLHHAGDVFAYAQGGGAFVGEIPWQSSVASIGWRNASGAPTFPSAPPNPPVDAAVWPTELRKDVLFTRQGNANSAGGQPRGDFDTLKGLSFGALDPTGQEPLAYSVLIRAYQYVVAKFDVDAFRIDTLKYLPPDFERVFANAMREFALSAGKKNFFTFGEVFDDEQEIAQFIGRNTTTTSFDTPVGVDAALDYPLFFKLPAMAKGLATSPNDVAQVYQLRKSVEEDILTSHGEAGQYFVTFLDNHDQSQRFGFTGPVQQMNQIALGLLLLYAMPGIPCIYYGTEQGLQGHKFGTGATQDDSMVREALWGKTSPAGAAVGFDPTHPLYQFLLALGSVRAAQSPLRYGRYYFRPISGDGRSFGISTFAPGVVALSRILNDQEVVVVANTNPSTPFAGEVIVDAAINTGNPAYRILLSNLGTKGTTPPVFLRAQGTVAIAEVNGATTNGPIRVLPVSLQPGEAQILAV
jgi:glycosidase